MNEKRSCTKIIKEKGSRTASRYIFKVMKNVLMPQYLFTALYRCMVINLPGKCENCIGCEKIRKWLEEKGEKIYVNEQYKRAKLSTDPAEREQAFLKYMNAKSYNTGDIKNGK